MPDSTLCFTSVSVKRLYGIDHDIEIDALCEGVNVVHGPNASGKTVVAHTFRALLWPEDTKQLQPIVRAAFHCDGDHWTAQLEGSRYVYQRDGIEASRPIHFPKTHRDRYHLYLHDLLASTDGTDAFAEAILQEAAGGFDVQEAKDRLGFTVRRLSARKKETVSARKARKALREARSKQDELKKERDHLEVLREEKEEAQQARLRVGALEQALKVVDARRALEEAKLEVEAFPDQLDAVREGDEERLDELNGQVAEAVQTIEEATGDHEEAREALQESIVPDEGLPDGLLETLRAKIEDLNSQEQHIRETTSRLEGARAEEESAWERLEFGREKELVAGIDLPVLNDLERTVENVEMLRAERRTRKYLKEIAGEVADPQDRAQLRKGLEALHRWLLAAASSDADVGRWQWGTAAVGLVLAAIGALLVFQTVGIALVLSAAVIVFGVVVLLIGMLLPRALASEGGEEATRRSDFEQLQLDGPSSWTREDVWRCTDELFEALREAEIEAEKQAAWERWENHWEALDEELEEAEEELARFAAKLGVDGKGVRANSLLWLATRLAAWQDARADVTGRAAELKEAEQEAAARLEAINERLAPYELGGVEDAAEARAARDRLASAQSAHREATQQAADAQRRIERAEKDRDEAFQKRSELYERLGLADGREADLRELCSQHDDFQHAREKERGCEITYKTQLGELEQHPGHEEGMAERSGPALQEQLAAARERAQETEEIAEQITRIEQRIEQAEDGHEIEERQAAYRLALDDLQRQREADYEQAVGAVMADIVREQTRDRDLPDVFQRASELFADITGGRYRLKLDREHTTFWAYDVEQQQGLALDALSSGTKVQLLLAVRVAFVETQERGCRLPLVLDEVLANSDDGKADAIIGALRTICAEGRQIMYLTAQEDEVIKWQEALQQGGVPFNVVSLEDRSFRHRTSSGDGAVLPARPVAPDVDDVGGVSHEAYREIAEVPAWSPRQPAEALHLWYLIDDVPLLHRLLDTGIPTWGALQNLAELSGPGALDVGEDTFARIEARAEAVAAWREAWLVGRGRPVDRHVLEAADGVSDKFIDEVAELAKTLDGDAERLIEALENGAVAYFRSDKREELRSYLQQEGCLDAASTLTPQQMWQRVVARVGSVMQELQIDAEALRTLFSRFEARTPAQQG